MASSLKPATYVTSAMKWQTNKLGYSFYQNGQYYNGEEKPTELPSAIQAGIATVLKEIELYINVKFTYISNGTQSQNTLIFANSTSADYAYGYLPGKTSYSGDVFLNPLYNNKPAEDGGFICEKGDYGYSTFIHEIGHALGLSHPFDPIDNQAKQPAPIALDNESATVMSYTDTTYKASTLMPLDIAALQKFYKPNTAPSSGDTTYSFTSVNSFQFKGISLGTKKKSFVALFDDNGYDTLSFQSLGTSIYADLTPGTGFITESGAEYSELITSDKGQTAKITSFGTFICENTLIESVIGTNYNDTIIGNNNGNLLISKEGSDVLIGGLGADVFCISDATKTSADTIKDFKSSDSDKLLLDLSQQAVGAGNGQLFAEFINSSKSEQFISKDGSEFTTSLQRLLFDTSSGAVWFDADGSGSNYNKTKLATLQGASSLSFNDFLFDQNQAILYVKPVEANIDYKNTDWATFPFAKLFDNKPILSKFQWSKVSWPSLSESQIEQIKWTPTIALQAIKSEGFQPEKLLKASSFKSIASGTNAAATAVLSKLNWPTISLAALPTETQLNLNWDAVNWSGKNSVNYSKINWSNVDFKDLKSATYGKVNWNQVNVSSLSETQYQEINWNKVAFKTIKSVDYAQLDWNKVISDDSFTKAAAKTVDWQQVKTLSNKALTQASLDKLAGFQLKSNGQTITALFPQAQDTGSMSFVGLLTKPTAGSPAAAGSIPTDTATSTAITALTSGLNQPPL